MDQYCVNIAIFGFDLSKQAFAQCPFRVYETTNKHNLFNFEGRTTHS